MISDRKAKLREEIEKRERELERLEALPDFEALVNGTVLALFVTYGGSRPYSVIALKERGSWYLTGERSPNGVSSEALASWLVSSGRRLVGAEVMGEVMTATASVVDLGALLRDFGPKAGAVITLPRLNREG